MSIPAPPELAAVLPTDTWETIRPVVEGFGRQRDPARIELVLVVPSRSGAGLEGMPRYDFGAVRIVEVGSILPLARARAAGVRAATAPLVFLGETHAFPHAGFTDAVLAAAEDGVFSVIVPGFGNANPKGSISWAGFLSDYGGWHHAQQRAEIASMPTWNAIYRRSVLLELGDRLEQALGHGDEVVLHVRARGRRVLLQPEARLDHVNVSDARAFLRERLVNGWLIGANRGRLWGRGRRVAYAAAGPLIAAVLAKRVVPRAWRSEFARSAPAGTVPLMLAAATLQAFGESIGYAFGPSVRIETIADEIEVHRLAYLGRNGRSALRDPHD
jgi:hypothetical protein